MIIIIIRNFLEMSVTKKVRIRMRRMMRVRKRKRMRCVLLFLFLSVSITIGLYLSLSVCAGSCLFLSAAVYLSIFLYFFVFLLRIRHSISIVSCLLIIWIMINTSSAYNVYLLCAPGSLYDNTRVACSSALSGHPSSSYFNNNKVKI